MTDKIDLTQFTYEDLAHALYVKGESQGFSKVTDKTKWRELVMAEKLGHHAFPKISAGRDTPNYGADADNLKSGTKAEYKSQALEKKQLRNLLRLTKSKRTNTAYTALVVSGVYNGAYTYSAIDSYQDKEHYFGIFYQELCVLILRIHNTEVDRQLREELDRRAASEKSGSTNLNSVRISLNDTALYEVAYRNDQWFEKQKVA
jgi:hypothetical protein